MTSRSDTAAHGSGARVYEDFTVGDRFRHPLGRTLISADNVWFTLLTMNTNPIHFNADYAGRTWFGRPLVNSCLTLAVVTGLSVSDLSQHAFANLGWDEVRLPAPVYEGDTLYAESEVVEVRPSESRPSVGLVRVRTRGFNADGVIVIEFLRSILVFRAGHVPDTPEPKSDG
jgi:itaconyl-CoA hydratase